MSKPNPKEHILAAGLTLLHSKGFNATSVQDITDAAGVPKGSFYNHFASKEALGLAALERYAEAAARLGQHEGDAALPPPSRIRAYFERMIQANAENAFQCGCMLGNFSTELSAQSPLIRRRLEQAFDGWGAWLADIIAAGQRDGSIAAPQGAFELAGFIIDAWQGAVLHAKAAQSRAPLDRFLDLLMNRIL